jgi:acylphosphatase
MQAHLIITGSVQGIGYRQFVKQNARKLGLTGWVKNLANGSVEAVVQGNKEVINQLISLCRKGPFLSEVKDVQISWDDTDTMFSDFVVLRD